MLAERIYINQISYIYISYVFIANKHIRKQVISSGNHIKHIFDNIKHNIIDPYPIQSFSKWMHKTFVSVLIALEFLKHILGFQMELSFYR